ncbi:hypothetical protein EAH87_10280 [Sphingomonas koreensis]|nr:hypothetical protein EAH87_10280 [Sphingomonas koreensis]
MRCRFLLSAAPLVGALLVAGCVPRVAPPAPAPAPRYVAPPPAPAPTPAGDWRDWPLTPGDWVYRQDGRGSIALFGPAGADAAVTLRCDAATRRVYLSRAGTAAPASAMTIVTTSLTRALPSQPTGGSPAYMAAALTPGDRLLDAIGYSRGRFLIQQAGMPTLVVPAYPEILRVTEDCRK